MSETRCAHCGRPLDAYDVGAFRRLVNRGAASGFLCIPCLARRFSCSESRIWEKIREFQETGCTLFPPLGET